MTRCHAATPGPARDRDLRQLAEHRRRDDSSSSWESKFGTQAQSVPQSERPHPASRARQLRVRVSAAVTDSASHTGSSGHCGTRQVGPGHGVTGPGSVHKLLVEVEVCCTPHHQAQPAVSEHLSRVQPSICDESIGHIFLWAMVTQRTSCGVYSTSCSACLSHAQCFWQILARL